MFRPPSTDARIVRYTSKSSAYATRSSSERDTPAAALQPEWTEVAPGRPNVTCSARLGSRPGMVTFTGHLDTVHVAEGWGTDPFEPTERDGSSG